MDYRHITTLSSARSGHNFVLTNVLSWFKEPFQHHNLEAIEPSRLMPNHLRWGGIKLLIWRDFDDWLASTIMYSYKMGVTRSIEDIPEYIHKVVKVYFAIMQEAKQPQYFHADQVVHYDEFVSSLKYRKNLCKALNGTYSEDDIDFVPRHGKGSSFDGRRLNGRGREMDVLNRAKAIKNTDHRQFYLKIMEEYGQT